MRYIATELAIEKLNNYNMTETEVKREFDDYTKLDEEKRIDPNMFFNMKNKDLIIMPIGKQTALIFEYGKELKGSYEDLPQIEYIDGIWKVIG